MLQDMTDATGRQAAAELVTHLLKDPCRSVLHCVPLHALGMHCCDGLLHCLACEQHSMSSERVTPLKAHCYTLHGTQLVHFTVKALI